MNRTLHSNVYVAGVSINFIRSAKMVLLVVFFDVGRVVHIEFIFRVRLLRL